MSTISGVYLKSKQNQIVKDHFPHKKAKNRPRLTMDNQNKNNNNKEKKQTILEKKMEKSNDGNIKAKYKKT